MMHSTTSPADRLRRLLPILFWLLVWQLAAMDVGQSILLASPIETLGRLLVLIRDAAFWHSVLSSLSRILSGFLLGLVTGMVFAVLSVRSRVADALLAPLLKVIKSVPVASFVIAALIWVPSRHLSILISFLIVCPVIQAGARTGLQSADGELLELARVFRMPLLSRVRDIYLPALLPQLSSAASVGIALAWKSGIAAEVIGIPKGSIGERLYEAKIYLATPDLFAWTITIVVMSALCEGLLSLAFRLVRRCLRSH